MELAFIVWVIGIIPQLSALLSTLGFSITGLVLFGMFMSFGEGDEKSVKVCKKILMFSVPIAFLGFLLPDKETIYAMTAAYGVQTVIENPKAQELASDGVDVLKALMSKAKKELEKEEK